MLETLEKPDVLAEARHAATKFSQKATPIATMLDAVVDGKTNPHKPFLLLHSAV